MGAESVDVGDACVGGACVGGACVEDACIGGISIGLLGIGWRLLIDVLLSKYGFINVFLNLAGLLGSSMTTDSPCMLRSL